ncbi:MAG: AIR carboxylase family protein [Armatimonadetes bacterium]|nr:AIR carboxylase family protein [Armatimonadota bacterium]
MPAHVKEKIAEGKTKVILPDPQDARRVLVHSKDQITAGDGAKKDQLRNKGKYSTTTTCRVFSLLNACGIPTHFVEQLDDTTFRAERCDMIPLEVVIRRVATGSYLKRHPDIKEGRRFSPPLVELFLKDDARHDPLMAPGAVLLEETKTRHGIPLQEDHLDAMKEAAFLIFLILEKAWAREEVMLCDLKVEFGLTLEKRLILADVIDNDSWRLWPDGEKNRMLDKQVYRNLKESTPEALESIERNYKKVADLTEHFSFHHKEKVVVFMGSKVDEPHAHEIQKVLRNLGIEATLRVLSAHKATRDLLEAVETLDSEGSRLVYIAVAGKSNGLGPVLDGNTPHPVINCPPYSEKFQGMDILSSLRMPSGIACTTLLEPSSAALAAAKILALDNLILWGRILVYHEKMRKRLSEEDREIGVRS